MRIHRHRQHRPQLHLPQFKANEKILAEEVFVIDEKGEKLGAMPKAKAIELAHSKELDLVEVSPKAVPPVCRLLDYGQFKYQKEKEARKQKAQSKEVEIKGIRLTFRIGPGDLETRLNQTKKFLERGDKVKVELVLRGREKGHKDVARELIDSFLVSVRALYPIRLEQSVAYQDGKMTCVIARV